MVSIVTKKINSLKSTFKFSNNDFFFVFLQLNL